MNITCEGIETKYSLKVVNEDYTVYLMAEEITSLQLAESRPRYR